MRAHNLLAHGSGGIDWAGLPLVAQWLGIDDVDALLASLEIIVNHRPPQPDADPQRAAAHADVLGLT